MARHFRYIVVGRGLMGSAAGRHLAERLDGVALIGPDEPEGDWSKHNGVFASHYDEGRITRSIDPDRIWATFAGRAIARYRDIEQRSGVKFYQEKGALLTGPSRLGGDTYVADSEAVAARLGLDVVIGGIEMLSSRFPYFAFPDGTEGIFEPGNAGHISPRQLVKAQNILAEKARAEIIRSVVTRVSESNGGVAVETSEGETLTAERVLVAAGGFSIQKNLLPKPLEMSVYARTVVFFEIDEAEAQRLSGMPSMINKAPDIKEDTYMLPPILYPDGKYYMKIGGDPEEILLPDGDAIAEWFRTGPRADVAEHLIGRMRSLVPDLGIRSTHAKPCVTSYAANLYPAIGWVEPSKIAVVTAGRGASAKSSDEIGRLGGELLSEGEITTPGYEADFSPVFSDR